MKSILIILLLPARLLAQVVFSEILYNEPGSRVSLEWIEVYNRADTAVDLKNYIFISGNDTTSFFHPVNAVIQPGNYAVLARHLAAIDNNDSFEGHWGDSSGYWGDARVENYRAFEVQMNLSNVSGVAYLVNIINGAIEQCVWNEPAAEGQSLERDRVEPPSATWHLSTDPSGSTPGLVNSENSSQVTEELVAFSSKIISTGKGQHLRIDYSVPLGCRITLELFDDSGHKRSTLVDKASTGGQIDWDGKSGNGSRLPPGVYMVLVTITGNQDDSRCVPIVIAP